MTHLTRLAYIILPTLLIGLSCGVPAQAQNNRTFISGAGSDANACTFVSPCRSAQRAHDMTNPGGEINVLDPAGYGSLTITKAISIQGHGWGEIVGFNGATAIMINAGANDAISLGGLIVEGVGSGNKGITFNTGGNLSIQDSVIRNMSGDGIAFLPASSSSLSVSHSFIGHNGGYGILVQPIQPGSAIADFDRVVTQYNGAAAYGIALDARHTLGNVTGTVTDSLSSSNGGGYLVQGANALQANLTLTRSVASNNHTGVQSGSTDGGIVLVGMLRLNQVTITGNQIGINPTGPGGIVESMGNNVIRGNPLLDGNWATVPLQ